MIDVVSAVFAALSCVVVCAAIAARPHHARCPSGWFLPEGVRADGHFVCRPVPPIRDGTSPRGGYLDLSVQPPGSLYGRVYCRGRAFTTDGTTVGCLGD